MAKLAKALSAAAGNAAGDKVYVEDVFSTYLYDGNSTDNTAANTGLDMSGEGGLVWNKRRDGATDHILIDTARGVEKFISSNNNSPEASYSGSLKAFTSTGYTMGTAHNYNGTGGSFNSWSWRKQKGFFDVVSFTGDGTSNRNISHSLDATVGSIFFKRTDTYEDWYVYHRNIDSDIANAPYYKLVLNNNNAKSNNGSNGIIGVTTSTFKVHGTGNVAGATYVAYIFAAGESDSQIFGDDGDEAIIKTGSYTGNGTTPNATTEQNGPTVNLGFEPQWLLIKDSSASDDWYLFDTMRGFTSSFTGSGKNYLKPNTNSAEGALSSSYAYLKINSTGFKITAGTGAIFNENGNEYIYIAIRRGPMKEPAAGTDVYAGDKSDTSVAPMLVSNFPVDMAFWRRTDVANAPKIAARLTGTNMVHGSDNSAAYSDSDSDFDFQNGYYSWAANNPIYYGGMFRRYPKVFDVVCYSPLSTDPNPKNVHNHNLTVKPELIILKQTTAVYASRNWAVGAPDLLGVTSSDTLGLNLNVAEGGSGTYDLFASTQPTATQFTVGYNSAGVGVFGESYVAYLFATLAGVSKVGSVVHSGTTNVDCGFSGGARFVMVKRTDSTGDWYIFDTTQGIESGNDPYVLMNSTAAQVTNTDYIDPLASGFTLTSNFTAGTYLFLAFA